MGAAQRSVVLIRCNLIHFLWHRFGPTTIQGWMPHSWWVQEGVFLRHAVCRKDTPSLRVPSTSSRVLLTLFIFAFDRLTDSLLCCALLGWRVTDLFQTYKPPTWRLYSTLRRRVYTKFGTISNSILFHLVWQFILFALCHFWENNSSKLISFFST